MNGHDIGPAEHDQYLLADELMTQDALRTALFKASMTATRLSHFGYAFDCPSGLSTRPASPAPSNEDDDAWPPPRLTSKFSDATSTVHSTLSLGLQPDFAQSAEHFATDVTSEQLARLEALERIVADPDEPDAALKVAEWVGLLALCTLCSVLTLT